MILHLSCLWKILAFLSFQMCQTDDSNTALAKMVAAFFFLNLNCSKEVCSCSQPVCALETPNLSLHKLQNIIWEWACKE